MAGREHPILFGDELVRAIIAGTKTQTRRPIVARGRARILLQQATEAETYTGDGSCLRGAKNALVREHSPFGAAGDRLWVRECWALEDLGADGQRIVWRADRAAAWHDNEGARQAPFFLDERYQPARWRPSIHMPRWASRIVLDVIGVRVERVRDITLEGARAEGIPDTAGDAHLAGFYDCNKMPSHEWDNRSTVENFAWIWERIYPGSWERNDWVWCVEFRRAT